MRHVLLLILASLSSLYMGCDTAPLPYIPGLEDTDGFLPPDFTIPVRIDQGGPSGFAVTGEPCKASSDCRRSMAPGNASGLCTKTNMIGGHGTVMWPEGYCQAPCRPAKNDPLGVNNTDCSGDVPVCVGAGTGTCYAGCISVNDCRDDYVCAYISGTPTAVCVPRLATECDPLDDPRPSGKTCSPGQRCVKYSPDNSYGGCAQICDPVTQNCPPAMMGADGCTVDLQVNDGSGDCISANENNQEGSPCIFLNDCAAGTMCYGQKCRSYCRTGGKACPQGQTCKNISLSGVAVKFKADVTGICVP